MRDSRFVAEHRGGPLKKEQHRQLMQWGCICAENVLSLLGKKIDERLLKAITVAKDWLTGNASVGEARKASVGAHDVAREASNPISIAVARSVGHAVATAHMADHSLGAAIYALKAVKSAIMSFSDCSVTAILKLFTKFLEISSPKSPIFKLLAVFVITSFKPLKDSATLLLSIAIVLTFFPTSFKASGKTVSNCLTKFLSPFSEKV